MGLTRVACRNCGRLLFKADLQPPSVVEIQCPHSSCKTLNTISPAPVVPEMVSDGQGGMMPADTAAPPTLPTSDVQSPARSTVSAGG